jgi:hypothetical protein
MDKYLKIMPFGLVLTLSAKCIFVGTTFADVAFLGVLSALGCYMHFATKEKRVNGLEQKHVELEKKFEAKAKEIDDVKNHLSGLKLASAIRPSSGKF